MKVKVTFPGEHVEFDVKDIPDLLRLCEGAKCFREEGYGRSKYRTYIEDPITMELPVTRKEAPVSLEPGMPAPAPPPPPADEIEAF
jgi:hypothetical protein